MSRCCASAAYDVNQQTCTNFLAKLFDCHEKCKISKAKASEGKDHRCAIDTIANKSARLVRFESVCDCRESGPKHVPTLGCIQNRPVAGGSQDRGLTIKSSAVFSFFVLLAALPIFNVSCAGWRAYAEPAADNLIAAAFSRQMSDPGYE